MSFLKDIEENKTVLRTTDVVTRESKLERMIVQDEEDYFRLMKETYFEKYYTQIERFTFKSVLIPLSLEDIQAIYDANKDFETDNKCEFDLNNVAAKIDEGIKEVRLKQIRNVKFLFVYPQDPQKMQFTTLKNFLTFINKN